MYLEFKPTKKAGGVNIEGDQGTLHLIERLLTKQAITTPYCCYDSGVCMTLSRYFEGRCSKPVDWITLFAGISLLRTSLGYSGSRQQQILVTLLEYELHRTLTNTLNVAPEKVDAMMLSLSGKTDKHLGTYYEKLMVKLYLLKTASARKKNLINLIMHLDPNRIRPDKELLQDIEHLDISQLYYSMGEKFQYEL